MHPLHGFWNVCEQSSTGQGTMSKPVTKSTDPPQLDFWVGTIIVGISILVDIIVGPEWMAPEAASFVKPGVTMAI
ncbi:hypothetical protein D9756_011454 [Leucocoprinus leucothites]|uniref:Uncharacterized protein n=1 Tax=Leucocoprinus leucothites TaxID=201217 RepID=A0A8H5FQ42_9AGAR|nr:hypothetical protein D9756_011454 [Leucoagaricus leucothites]